MENSTHIQYLMNFGYTQEKAEELLKDPKIRNAVKVATFHTSYGTGFQKMH